MMVATFPLALASLADLVNVRTVQWRMRYNQEYSGIGSGEILTADLGPPLWEADVETPPMSIAAAEQLAARFDLLDGATRTFYLYNPRMRYPQADPEGTTLGASTVTITGIGTDRNTLSLAGLPANYVLTIGDMIAITYSGRRALIRFAETMTANGSGALGPIEVRPYIRSGITTADTTTLAKPAAKMKLLPDTLRVQQLDTVQAMLTFSCRQTLEA